MGCKETDYSEKRCDSQDSKTEVVDILMPVIPSNGWKRLAGFQSVLHIVVRDVEVDGLGISGGFRFGRARHDGRRKRNGGGKVSRSSWLF